jgi:hypothetical protein
MGTEFNTNPISSVDFGIGFTAGVGTVIGGGDASGFAGYTLSGDGLGTTASVSGNAKLLGRSINLSDSITVPAVSSNSGGSTFSSSAGGDTLSSSVGGSTFTSSVGGFMSAGFTGAITPSASPSSFLPSSSTGSFSFSLSYGVYCPGGMEPLGVIDVPATGGSSSSGFGSTSFGFGDFGSPSSSWDVGSFFGDFFNQIWDPFFKPGAMYPIMLDLDGGGIEIDPLTSSNTFFDMAGDGYQHRTAWAGAGDAVLAFDANNDGVIDQKNEIIFTEWDPTAVSDMQALRNVFDTDANGQLDAGDDKFSQFKLIITNADGTKTLQSLTQAGIASIALKEDNSSQVFIDGSSIDGQTSFTRTDGTTGVAATVTLMSEAAGYALQTTTTTDASGAVTVDNKAYNPDGSLASETISVISADGASRALSSDIDGDGVIDLIQTELTVVNGDGSRTKTLTDKTAGGVDLDKIVTREKIPHYFLESGLTA